MIMGTQQGSPVRADTFGQIERHKPKLNGQPAASALPPALMASVLYSQLQRARNLHPREGVASLGQVRAYR